MTKAGNLLARIESNRFGPTPMASRAQSEWRGLSEDEARAAAAEDPSRIRGSVFETLEPYVGPQRANTLAGAVDFVPGLGDAAGFEDAAADFREGRYGMGAFNTLASTVGLVPGLGDAAAAGLKGVAGAMAGIPANKLKGITAYHGSPHDFDRFDMGKIGTGEGAQAYGHGLYFADSENVARSYRDKLGGLREGVTFNGNTYDPIMPADIKRLSEDSGLSEPVAREVMAYFDETPDEMIESAKRWPSERSPAIVQAAEWRRANDLSSGGRMYQVRIDADPDAFLDWDVPLSEQPENVRQGIRKSIPEIENYLMEGKAADPEFDYSIKDILYNFDETEELGGVDVIERGLRDAGIPGIKYYDAGSRGAGEGTRNYVVFDDRLVTILKKYGIGAAVVGGAYALTPEEYEQAAEVLG